jgi:hypothetical protein
MIRPPVRLYHLADADNLPSIHKHGLMSTARLLGLAGVEEAKRTTLIRAHRPDNLRLSETIVIRDQRSMPPQALARALNGGLEPADWYELLNSFVFLWPDRERLERHRRATGSRPQFVLTFDAAVLLDQFETEAFVSPINSGNARRKAVRRDRDTLVPYRTWLKQGWATGQRTRPPAEFLFRCSLRGEAPQLIDVSPV